MSVCQRTNAGVAGPVARWLQRHGAVLVVDDRLEDAPVRYLLARGVTSAGMAFPRMPHTPPEGVVARFRSVGHFALAIETPGAITWS